MLLISFAYDPSCLLNCNPAMSKRLVAAAGNVALGSGGGEEREGRRWRRARTGASRSSR